MTLVLVMYNTDTANYSDNDVKELHMGHVGS